jgi:ABC-type oligopeptide transport system substrate-binding subunit
MCRLSRSKVLVLSLLVLSGAMSLQGCAKKKEASPQADPKYVAASQSLERLKADAQRLQAETAAIRKRL